MEQLGTAPETMRRRVEETLDLLGIADLRARDLRTLSGGQQQRVAIGSVLTTHPRVLVLDEPTSALDPTAAEDVLATITRLVHDLGLTVLLAEHRLERVVPFADRIAWSPATAASASTSRARSSPTRPVAPPLVDLGRLARLGPAAAHRPRRPTPRAVAARPHAARAGRRARDRGRCSPRAVSPSCTAPTSPSARSTSPCPTGRVTVLMGRNGSGKSSLIWALQGSGKRRSGTVDVGGDDPATLAPAQRRTHVGLVPQTAADLLYLETVADECAAADAGAEAASRHLPRAARPARPRHRRGPPPARPVRGPAARARALDRADRPTAGAAARRAHPRPRLRRQGRARPDRRRPRRRRPGGPARDARRRVRRARGRRGRRDGRGRGRLQRPAAPGARRVAVLRPAGHQGARRAVARRRGSRRRARQEVRS